MLQLFLSFPHYFIFFIFFLHNLSVVFPPCFLHLCFLLSIFSSFVVASTPPKLCTSSHTHFQRHPSHPHDPHSLSHILPFFFFFFLLFILFISFFCFSKSPSTFHIGRCHCRRCGTNTISNAPFPSFTFSPHLFFLLFILFYFHFSFFLSFFLSSTPLSAKRRWLAILITYSLLQIHFC